MRALNTKARFHKSFAFLQTFFKTPDAMAAKFAQSVVIAPSCTSTVRSGFQSSYELAFSTQISNPIHPASIPTASLSLHNSVRAVAGAACDAH